VLLDGLEITQFTYFQQAGGIDLEPCSVELTYGLERIAMFLNNIDNCFELPWNQKNTYRSIRYEDEKQFSKYYFEEADVKLHFSWFEEYERESARLLESELWLPAYDY